MKFILVMREPGKLDPDYSLDFEAPILPRVGDLISVHRVDTEGPWGEDAIVRAVWWRLDHPETGGIGSDPPKVGSVTEIFVECEPATGPYSSDHWRDMLEARRKAGEDVPRQEVARVSIRQDAFAKQ